MAGKLAVLLLLLLLALHLLSATSAISAQCKNRLQYLSCMLQRQQYQVQLMLMTRESVFGDISVC